MALRIARFGTICAVVIIAVVGAALAAGQNALPLAEFKHSVAVLETGSGRYPITVEIAETPEQRALGLQYRQTLAEDAGMLFDFRQSQLVAMWMKNTLIPLDMIFLDDAGQIIAIAHNTTPLSLQTLSSPRPARAVLEVNGGLSERYRLQPGDAVCHAIFSRADC